MSAGIALPTGDATVRSPDEVLRELGVSARGLFEIFVLGRCEAERQRLAERVEVVASPGDPVEGIRGGDLLVRGAMGEGIVLMSVLVDGELHDRAAAEGDGLDPEGRLPGRYAWVIEDGTRPHPREDRFARRVTDRRGFLPHDQAVLRMTAAPQQLAPPPPPPPPAPPPAPPPPELLAEAVNRQSRDYIRWYQDALNRIDSAGLDVDGIHGPLTRAAVRRYQTRKGLAVDGIVGPNTEGALLADGAPLPSGAVPLTFDLLVDGDRDGAVDGAAGTSTAWIWGPTGKGAVLLVNNDDDGIHGAPDNEDSTVDAGNDRNDLAPLRISTSGGPAPAGTTLDLIVDRPDVIRIFSSRTAGGTEIVGPGTGATHRFPSLPTSALNLGMEALRYAGTGFDGEIKITLRTTDPGGTPTDQMAIVRVAPWIMPSHLVRGEKVFVVDAGSSNARFRTDLRPMIAAAGARLVQFPLTDDPWMQDCMEFGFASIPGVALRTVLRAPRDAPLLTFPRSLLGTDLGYVELGAPAPFITFNSNGNLEVTPPFTSPSGKRFPFGRIYFGPGRGGLDVIDSDVEEFLRKQIVQDPIKIDTSWLAVGHVDEVLSFVPAPGSLGFKMLIASPRRAYQILDALNATNPTDKLLLGRSFPVLSTTPQSLVNVEQTIGAFLGLSDDFHPDLQALVAAGIVTHTAKPLRDFNTDRQANIDGIRSTMVAELGIGDADIVEIPAVFMPSTFVPQAADALIPGMVNMLVVNGHCIVPKPFGPRVGTPRPVDRFEEDVRTQLGALGLHVHFLDCWEEYHVNLGEVHCATNTLRRATPVKWWEFQP